MKWLGYLVLLVVLIIGLIFAILNAEPVTLNYLVGRSTMALSLVVAIAFFIGGCVGLLVGLLGILRYKRRLRALQRELQRTQQKLAVSDEEFAYE